MTPWSMPSLSATDRLRWVWGEGSPSDDHRLLPLQCTKGGRPIETEAQRVNAGRHRCGCADTYRRATVRRKSLKCKCKGKGKGNENMRQCTETGTS